MKCRACQNELLVTADPGRPSPAAAEHLANCPSCQEWQRHLLRIESNIGRIPVPATRAKESLLRRLTQEVAAPAPLAPPPTLPFRRPHWRLSAVGVAGLVAAVLLIACGIFLGNFLARSLHSPATPELAGAAGATAPTSSKATPGTAPNKKGPGESPAPQKKGAPLEAPAPSPLLARLLACDLTLAGAATPPQRLEALASLADALQGETRALAREAGSDDLQALARLYEKVIQKGIVARARSLPAGQRRAVLGPIATRLIRARREMDELASRSGPGASGPLLQLAAAADAGGRSLRDLLPKEAP